MSQYESLPLYLETNCNQEVYSNPFKFIFSISTFLGSYPSEGMAITSREDGALMVEETSPENEMSWEDADYKAAVSIGEFERLKHWMFYTLCDGSSVNFIPILRVRREHQSNFENQMKVIKEKLEKIKIKVREEFILCENGDFDLGSGMSQRRYEARLDNGSICGRILVNIS